MMKGTLLTAVVVVVLLAGGAQGQSQEKCMSNVMSSLKMLEPILPISKMIQRFKTMGGLDGALENLKNSMRTCVCSEVEANPTNETICKCMKELDDCDTMYKPTVETPKGEFITKATSYMNCLGVDRMAACLKCKEKVNENPLHMVCMSRGITCPNMEMKDGM